VAVDVIGRSEELAAVDSFLDSLPGGPTALVVTGEAGIGKTTIWRAGLEAARRRDFWVLAASPAQAEANLSFGALGDVLDAEVTQLLPRLTAPRRRALEAALLLGDVDGPPPDQRAVALGFFDALRTLAESCVVLVALDDVQWLDAPSAAVLGFAVRRRHSTQVAFLIAQRVAADEPLPLGLDRGGTDGVTTLHVGPLAIGALHRVLHEQLGVSLPRPILLRIHEVSNGNPFFALEIARAIGGRDLPPLVSEPLPIPATLRELVHERIAELPAATRSALVAASAVSQPTPELIEAAGGSRANLQPAIDEGVIRLADDRIQFAHPLLAAAAYADADASQLRDVHSRLAELVDDLEERARHLALSTDGPDDAVAAVVEEAARRSRARGASATAAELAEQAFRLTAGHQPREATTRRAVAAADWALEAGDSAKARRLLEELVALLPPGPERADALSRLGWVILTRRPPERTGPLHRQALEEATDTAVKVRAHRGLSWAAHVAGDLGTAEVHARSAVELAELDCDPTNLALSLADLAFVEALRGRGLSRETMQRALELEERLDTLPIVGRPTWVFGVLLAMTGELDEARGLLDRLRHRASERGEENATPYILNWLSRIECFAGRWQLALGHAEESHQSTLETGQDGQGAFTLSSLAMVRARLGDVDGARAGAHEALQRGRLLGLRSVDFEARATLGFLEVSLGRPEEADRWLGTLHEEVRQAGFGEPTVFRFHPDAIEALVSLGRLDRAAELLDYLAERGRTLDRPKGHRHGASLSRAHAG
jgi:tetratricopeptide (TPR) repeat protein